jgi:hypothetical protein
MKKLSPGDWHVTDECGDLKFSVVRRGSPSSKTPDIQVGNEADAALMASAKDLLAALKLVKDLAPSGSYIHPAVEAAIAKAEGRS